MLIDVSDFDIQAYFDAERIDYAESGKNTAVGVSNQHTANILACYERRRHGGRSRKAKIWDSDFWRWAILLFTCVQ